MADSAFPGSPTLQPTMTYPRDSKNWKLMGIAWAIGAVKMEHFLPRSWNAKWIPLKDQNWCSVVHRLTQRTAAKHVRKMQFVILRIRIGNCREYSNIQWYWLVASGSSYMGTTSAIDHSNLGILGCKYATMQQLGQIAPFASICPISPLPNGGPQNSSQTLSRTAIATWLVLSLDGTPLTPAWKRAPAVVFLEAATTWLPATSSSTVIQLKCSQVNVDLPHAWTFTLKISVNV